MNEFVAAAVATGGVVTALAASPYLASLTISVPDRTDKTWWRPRTASRVRTAAVAGPACVLCGLGCATALWTAAWPAYVLVGLVGSVLSVVDVEHHRLPDRLVLLATVGVGVVFSCVALIDGQWTPLVRAAAAAIATLTVLTALILIFPRAVGFGDAKLAALLASCLAWRSWDAVVDASVLAVLIAGAFALTVSITGRVRPTGYIPLGPFLISASLLVAAVRWHLAST